MNRLPIEKRVQIINLLVEGMSMRATSRIADVSINTVTKLLVAVGTACAEFQDKTLRNLPCKRVEADEIWSFCYSKAKNVPAEMKGQFGVGDLWTWTAICADTKLAVSWLVGARDYDTARDFMMDVSERLANRVQLTTDGFKPYLSAVSEAFNNQVDYAQLVKIYGQPADSTDRRRYSPAECSGTIIGKTIGKPDHAHISTSYVERQNLTMRMHMRRFTRLTNGFSKKAENHMHAVSLHFAFYNFAKIHKTLRVTPAMEAGISNHVWSIEEIVNLAK
jgi:IS1 family transposase